MKKPTYKELEEKNEGLREENKGLEISAKFWAIFSLACFITFMIVSIIYYNSQNKIYQDGLQDGLNNCSQKELNCILPAKEMTINNKTDCFLEYHYVTYNMDGSNVTDTVSYIEVGTGEMLK